MTWIAKERDTSGKIKPSNLSRMALDILEEIIPDFCETLVKRGNFEFEVKTLMNWVKIRYDDITPYRSSESAKKVTISNPGNRIFDAQNSCYHLGDAKNFWIEDSETGRIIEPFLLTGI